MIPHLKTPFLKGSQSGAALLVYVMTIAAAGIISVSVMNLTVKHRTDAVLQSKGKSLNKDQNFQGVQLLKTLWDHGSFRVSAGSFLTPGKLEMVTGYVVPTTANWNLDNQTFIFKACDLRNLSPEELSNTYDSNSDDDNSILPGALSGTDGCQNTLTTTVKTEKPNPMGPGQVLRAKVTTESNSTNPALKYAVSQNLYIETKPAAAMQTGMTAEIAYYSKSNDTYPIYRFKYSGLRNRPNIGAGLYWRANTIASSCVEQDPTVATHRSLAAFLWKPTIKAKNLIEVDTSRVGLYLAKSLPAGWELTNVRPITGDNDRNRPATRPFVDSSNPSFGLQISTEAQYPFLRIAYIRDDADPLTEVGTRLAASIIRYDYQGRSILGYDDYGRWGANNKVRNFEQKMRIESGGQPFLLFGLQGSAPTCGASNCYAQGVPPQVPAFNGFYSNNLTDLERFAHPAGGQGYFADSQFDPAHTTASFTISGSATNDLDLVYYNAARDPTLEWNSTTTNANPYRFRNCELIYARRVNGVWTKEVLASNIRPSLNFAAYEKAGVPYTSSAANTALQTGDGTMAWTSLDPSHATVTAGAPVSDPICQPVVASATDAKGYTLSNRSRYLKVLLSSPVNTLAPAKRRHVIYEEDVVTQVSNPLENVLGWNGSAWIPTLLNKMQPKYSTIVTRLVHATRSGIAGVWTKTVLPLNPHTISSIRFAANTSGQLHIAYIENKRIHYRTIPLGGALSVDFTDVAINDQGQLPEEPLYLGDLMLNVDHNKDERLYE